MHEALRYYRGLLKSMQKMSWRYERGIAMWANRRMVCKFGSW